MSKRESGCLPRRQWTSRQGQPSAGYSLHHPDRSGLTLMGKRYPGQDADDGGGHPDVVVGLDITTELGVQSRESQDADRPDGQSLAPRGRERTSQYLPDQPDGAKEEQ